MSKQAIHEKTTADHSRRVPNRSGMRDDGDRKLHRPKDGRRSVARVPARGSGESRPAARKTAAGTKQRAGRKDASTVILAPPRGTSAAIGRAQDQRKPYPSYFGEEWDGKNH